VHFVGSYYISTRNMMGSIPDGANGTFH